MGAFQYNVIPWRAFHNQYHSNIASHSRMTSDLTIKITVTHHSTLRCMGKIDTSMPFDFFTLTINGQQRNSYHTKLDGWIQIVDRISPGENTIVFRVENSEDSYGFNRTEEYFGGGHVYLDDCEIFPS